MPLHDSKKPRTATLEFTTHQVEVTLRAFKEVYPGPCGECKEAIAMLESALHDLTREPTKKEKADLLASVIPCETCDNLSRKIKGALTMQALKALGWDLVRIESPHIKEGEAWD
jgi:hypothetical protein